MRSTWTFHSAGQVLFGRNATQQLGEAALRLGVRRVLVVTDPALVDAGLAERVHPPLSEAGVAAKVFAGGEPEPSLRAAEAAVAAARDFRPDSVLGLGGGSNMDLAKITAVVLAHGGHPRDYFGEDKVPGPILPLICLPTTGGTGAEVSGAAVLTDADNHIKVSTLSNHLRPLLALVDPTLALSCPPRVTAESGLDALTHAVEAYTAADHGAFAPGEALTYQGRNPFADMLAERAVALVGTHLRRAVAHGNDLEAREGMALAALLAGLAFSNAGVALVHALEYPVGGAVHVSHGAGNGLLLPYVMRFNLPVRKRAFAAVARLLGEDVDGIDEGEAAVRAVAAVERLRSDVGVPGRLREIGVRGDQLRGFAEKAFAIKRLLRVNPRPATAEDLEGILQSAY